jgi:hypothetical protein
MNIYCFLQQGSQRAEVTQTSLQGTIQALRQQRGGWLGSENSIFC